MEINLFLNFAKKKVPDLMNGIIKLKKSYFFKKSTKRNL